MNTRPRERIKSLRRSFLRKARPYAAKGQTAAVSMLRMEYMFARDRIYWEPAFRKSLLPLVCAYAGIKYPPRPPWKKKQFVFDEVYKPLPSLCLPRTRGLWPEPKVIFIDEADNISPDMLEKINAMRKACKEKP